MQTDRHTLAGPPNLGARPSVPEGAPVLGSTMTG